MRLLVDAHCFDYKTTEGLNTYVKGLYSELVKIATDIDFYFLAQETENIKKIFGKADNIHYINLSNKGRLYKLIFEIPSIIKKYNIDIAHYQYVSPFIKNCKNIGTLHDVLFLDFPKMFPFKYRFINGCLFKFSAKRADLLLTVSEYSKKQISKHYNIPEKEIVVTPNAVSEDFRNIDKLDAYEFIKNKGIKKYILYVSRIEPRKNQISLLKAYNELDLYKQGYDLVFIGRKTLPTPEFDCYYSNLSNEEKKHIHIIDQVSYNDLKFWYKGASLFVYTALAEGFGIPPIEAAAAGIPCICSNRTAMGDFAFFDDNLVNPLDIDELKNKILLNIQNFNSLKLAEITKRIYEQYNWKIIARNYYNILKSKFKY